jgi:hypothetical protein
MMIAYHNDQSVKDAILAQLAAHRKADALVQDYGYWKGGKGCAVGCTLHSSDHAKYETRFGVPQMIAQIEDVVFEGLPVEKAREWPERLMKSVPVGADLSRVGWKFLHWILTDETVNPGISDPAVAKAISVVAGHIFHLSEGRLPWSGAALGATEAPRGVAWRSMALGAADAAAAAARSAAYAACAPWSAESAACAADAARSAAWSAASAAWTAEKRAAWAAERGAKWSAANSAENAAYVRMSDKLIELIEEAQTDKQN